MGWASGSGLMEDIICNLKLEIEDYDTRIRIYKVLITSFEEYDCDTLMECINVDDAFDDAYASFGYDLEYENEEEDY